MLVSSIRATVGIASNTNADALIPNGKALVSGQGCHHLKATENAVSALKFSSSLTFYLLFYHSLTWNLSTVP